MSTMRPRTFICLLLAWLVATATPSLAQYDRDGRYVPSPNGVPLDPNAQLIPLYPGTPLLPGQSGATLGTPRALNPPAAMPQALPPRLAEPSGSGSGLARFRRIRCADGWTARTGVSRMAFTRWCRPL
jgi:hypothetical protein